MPRNPTDEELLAIAKEALGTTLSDYHAANVEVSAANIADGTARGGETWNLQLIKMMLLCSFRVRQFKGLIKQ